MLARTRRRNLALGGLASIAVVVALAGAAHSPALRASCRAAYRAFRDPSLLDPPPPPPPLTVSCARLGEEHDRQLDAEISRSVDRPLPDDAGDPDGPALSTLTLPDLHVPITRRTLRYVRFLSKTDAGRAAFLQRHRRAALYRESVAFALREAGLPEDLLWLAAVESGFDPRAVSPAGAAGLWQMMPETGQLYGLDQSPYVDERRSIVRATHAAVTHLRDLYERFGRWDLALAAYNAGYDRVANAVAKVARARGPLPLDDKPIDFADLAAARALPEETINYVPQIMAFALVAANRSRFGLDVPDPDVRAPLELGEMAVPEGTRLRTVARAAGISVSVLREYNPQLLRDRVPPVGGDYLIALPEARVERALASFPSYSEQEVVAQNDGDHEGAAGDLMPPLASVAADGDPDADEPLPRRPIPLGRNRLPELGLRGHDRVLVAAAGFGVGILEAKLPASLAIPDVGWRRVYEEDPLGIFGAGGRGAKGRDAAIDKQLAFLDAPAPAAPLHSFALPNGITVRVRRDPGAPRAAITVRIATEEGTAEDLHTLSVDRRDLDAGIELAATRVRLALGDTASAELAEIRFRAGGTRRKLLQQTPYGQGWLALGEALFPADHPLAGTVLGAEEDSTALRDMMIAEAMRRERTLARASITVVGDVDELHAKKLAEAFLASVSAPADVPVPLHPREERLTVEDEVAAPHALLGWIGPGEGEVGDVSLRAAVEILENPHVARLRHTLVDRAGLCSEAHAGLELGPRASVATIELAPAPGHDVAEALRALDAEIDRLADKGPERGEVGFALYYLHARLQKERAAAEATGLSGAVHSASLAKLRHALWPHANEQAQKALDEVTVTTVRAAVRRFLAREHRVVVTTIPKGR